MIFTEGVGRVDIRETMRYLGYYGVKDAGDMQAVIDECKDIILPVLAPVACYECYPITRGTLLDLGFAKVVSRDLEKNLSGCDKLVLFGATVGAGVDRLILKYEKLSPARSIIFQALGAAAIECWCDDLNARITAEYGKTKPRYSCGYGDLSIELQRDIFNALPLTKRLGITLSDRCFMTPTKSVTAIIGVKNDT